MSLCIDSSEWISGALLIGETGLGVLGSAVPSSGESGAGYAYNDLAAEDAGKEICGRITTLPSAGVLYAYEDTSFVFSGAPDGTYSFGYQLYVDGVATGLPATVMLFVGTVYDNLQGADIILSSVAVSSPVVSQVHIITTKNIALETLSITKSVIEQVHILAALDIVADGFDLEKADIGQVHVLTPEPVSLFEFTVTKPVLLSSESTDNLLAKDIYLGNVSIIQAVIGQSHVLLGKDVSVGEVTASTPVVSQIHSLLSKSITLSALSLSNPTLSSATVTAVYPMPEQVLLGVTYGPSGTEYTGTLIVGPGATVYIEQILSEVVDDQVIVLLQDEVIQSNILSETT